MKYLKSYETKYVVMVKQDDDYDFIGFFEMYGVFSNLKKANKCANALQTAIRVLVSDFKKTNDKSFVKDKAINQFGILNNTIVNEVVSSLSSMYEINVYVEKTKLFN
mgnify:CR=1 FL=1|jgi:hypothetical protein